MEEVFVGGDGDGGGGGEDIGGGTVLKNFGSGIGGQ